MFSFLSCSRACRYYYGRDELVIVRKKMIYQFGPKSDYFKKSNSR